MNAARNLSGLVGAGRDDIPKRTVTAAPPRRTSPTREPAIPDVAPARPSADDDAMPAAPARRPRRQRAAKESVANRDGDSMTTRPATTVRISVNIPLTCKRWLAGRAREQQRFVSDIVMEALDRFGDAVSPPSGRAKRVAVPDGTICNIVLPVADRQQLDDIATKKNTTRSALLTEVLTRAGGS
jgi:hypothetical protein